MHDVTGVGGEGGFPRLEQKRAEGDGGYTQIVTSPPRKIMYKFLFYVCFWSESVAAELRLGFQ